VGGTAGTGRAYGTGAAQPVNARAPMGCTRTGRGGEAL
ncbi:MAG: hypothetical protein AVDCRST_MAG77-4609, partial [uncultured Chloroflexi bacterium]